MFAINSNLGTTTAIWLVVLLAAAACSADKKLTEDAEYQSGARLYRSLCASCHGPTGHGDGPVAAQLRTPPADLTLIAKRRGGHFYPDEIHQIIDGRWERPAHGTRDMPIWGKQLFFSADPNDKVAREQTEARIKWLVEYLQSMQQH